MSQYTQRVMSTGDLPPETRAEFERLLHRMQEESQDAPMIANRAYDRLREDLARYSLPLTAGAIAGLMTVPDYQTATVRFELLAHLAVLHCRGTKSPRAKDLRRWLDRDLAELPVRRDEDPPEDVFVSNVVAGSRNYRIFEGLWECGDYYLQHVLDCIGRTKWGHPYFRLRARVYALLTLSDAVADRAGLARWSTTERDVPHDEVIGGAARSPSELSRRATFSAEDLTTLGISLEQLEPFLISARLRDELSAASIHDSPLVRRPVLLVGDSVILTLPTAVSAAARHYVLDWVHENSSVSEFLTCLNVRQTEATFNVALPRIDAPEGLSAPESLEVKVERIPSAIVSERVVPIDTDKVAHVVLIGDDLSAIRDEGIASASMLSLDDEESLDKHLLEVAKQLSNAAPGGGLTIIVRGGLGRGAAFSFPTFEAPWHIIAVSLASFETFALSDGASLLRLWKLRQQVAGFEEAGGQVMNLSGELNLYAYWLQSRFLLAPLGMPFPPRGHYGLSIGSNHLYDLRVAVRRENDRHLAAFDSKKSAEVCRLHQHSFFSALSHRAIYIADELARRGELFAVVESSAPTLWILMDLGSSERKLRDFVHDIWDVTLTWMERLLPEVHRSSRWSDSRSAEPVTVTLRLDDLESWERVADLRDDEPVARPRTVVQQDHRAIDVFLPFGWCSLLRRPTNEGERALLEEMVAALFRVGRETAPDVLSAAKDEKVAAGLVAACMRGPDARGLHLFQSRQMLDFIVPVPHPVARTIPKEDSAFWARGLAWRSVRQPDQSAASSELALVVSGLAESRKFLNDTVARLWDAMRERLLGIDASSLISLLLTNGEAILWDRTHWRRTSRAMAALHGPFEDVSAVAGRRESERAMAVHATRVVVEMVICTAPATGGKKASLADADELLAAAALMVELAADSDAIRGGFTKPEVRVYENGSIAYDEDFLTSVVAKYGRETHAGEFRAAVSAYDDLFRERTDNTDGELVDEAFVEAFQSEFAITPRRFIAGFADLLKLAHERNELCVCTTRAEIHARLKKNEGFTEVEAGAFIQMLTLVPRPNWNEAPPGFLDRDWYPWRFRRRLSVVARPIVALGTAPDASCWYGIQQLRASVSYLFGGITDAWFPEAYFTSEPMRRFRGATAEKLGHAFAREVAADLEAASYETLTEVQMSSLGVPGDLGDLGDLDVIAWNVNEPDIWLIECKRQYPARTVGEIVERLLQFRGDSDDQLGKHLRRLEWIRANSGSVIARLGLPRTATFTPILVTNLPVPMQFTTGSLLPEDQIVTREQLRERLIALSSRGAR